jgi:hypothetical protein
MLRCLNDGVTTIKHIHQTTGKACVIWSDESSYTGKGLHLENTQGSLQYRIPGSNSETWGRFCDDLGISVIVQYSFGPIITLHVQITARKYMDSLGNPVHLMIEMLLMNDALFQDDTAPIRTAETVQCNYGLKSMKVNFGIFPGQYNHQI